MENYKVYMHVFPNGKVYIGITGQNVNERWRNGDGYKNQFVYMAIKKYGWDNIEHKILAEGITKEEAELKEIHLIHLYDSTNPLHGYNADNGGNCCGTHSAETRSKISRANTGRIASAETRKKISISNSGKTIPADVKEKISNTLKGREISEEAKIKIGNAHRGKIVSDETKAKISASKTGKPFHCSNPEERQQKISSAMCERNKNNPEIMNKMRELATQKCSKPVAQIAENGDVIFVWNSAAEIERILGINHVQISRACRKSGKVVCGYLWSFI